MSHSGRSPGFFAPHAGAQNHNGQNNNQASSNNFYSAAAAAAAADLPPPPRPRMRRVESSSSDDSISATGKGTKPHAATSSTVPTATADPKLHHRTLEFQRHQPPELLEADTLAPRVSNRSC